MKSLPSAHDEQTVRVRPSLTLRVAIGRVVLIALALLATEGAAIAGTVFMKNGYIIQGPIVDEDDEKIVLGWENGKLFIYRRFLESVELDSAEREAIERRRKAAAAKETTLQPLLDGESLTVADELPQTWSDVLEEYNSVFEAVPPISVEDFPTDGGTDVGTTDPITDPTWTDPVDPIIDVTPVRVERSVLDHLWLSIEPPRSWSYEPGERSARWTGPVQSDGLRPTLVIVRGRATEWLLEDAMASMREDPSLVLPDFQVIDEKSKTIGGQRAHEITGLGHLLGEDGSDDTPSLSVKQTLVPGDGGHFWIISTFASEVTPQDVMVAARDAVASIEFIATGFGTGGDTLPGDDSRSSDDGLPGDDLLPGDESWRGDGDTGSSSDGSTSSSDGGFGDFDLGDYGLDGFDTGADVDTGVDTGVDTDVDTDVDVDLDGDYEVDDDPSWDALDD